MGERKGAEVKQFDGTDLAEDAELVGGICFLFESENATTIKAPLATLGADNSA